MTRKLVRLCEHDRVEAHLMYWRFEKDGAVREAVTCPGGEFLPEWALRIPRYALLDVWMALGGDSRVFETWMNHPKRTIADAWAQLMGAIRGNIPSLLADTNPPADELLEIVARRQGVGY